MCLFSLDSPIQPRSSFMLIINRSLILALPCHSHLPPFVILPIPPTRFSTIVPSSTQLFLNIASIPNPARPLCAPPPSSTRSDLCLIILSFYPLHYTDASWGDFKTLWNLLFVRLLYPTLFIPTCSAIFSRFHVSKSYLYRTGIITYTPSPIPSRAVRCGTVSMTLIASVVSWRVLDIALGDNALLME